MFSSKTGVQDFLVELGARLDGDVVTNWQLNFRDNVLNWENQMKKLGNYDYPMAVAQILDTPRGPTAYQEYLKGIIVPDFGSSDENRRLNVGYGIAFLNAVILYMFELFQRGEYKQAYGLVCYLRTFQQGIIGLDPRSDWILTQQNNRRIYLKHGTVVPESAQDPYKNYEKIFV